jgi:hypothetical protein
MHEAGREVHRHLVPQPGRQWQNACTGALGIGPQLLSCDEDHAGSAERKQRVAVADHADARGARRVVAAAADHLELAAMPHSSATSARRVPVRSVPSTARGMCCAGQPGRGEQRIAPVALADVEPQRAGRIRHVRTAFSPVMQKRT